MPVYDYDCMSCGPFSAIRPMADYAKPVACDACGADAPRAIFNAPALANMNSGLRRSLAINERSRHEPRRSNGAHPAGCGCCSSSARKPSAANAAKSFPGSRPWMISH
jgi:putative FmdB family regulatory protein